MRGYSSPSTSSMPDHSPPRKWWAMVGVGLGVLMYTLDTSIVNVALPTLVQTLHTSFATVQWVVLSYLLMITVLVLSAARLGDMFGKQRLFQGGLILFTLSSLLCGLAPGVSWLIGFRALQGLGAVFISALAAALVIEVFPTSERGRALGINGSIVALGIASGPSIGGLLIGLGGWRAIFLVNVPIGIVASLIVARVIPPSVGSQGNQRFDGLGTLILMATLSCFALGMTDGQRRGFGNETTLVLLSVAAMGFVCFLLLESRLKQPLLDLRLFRNLRFSLNLLTGLLVFIVVAGSVFIMPFFLELVKHYSPQQVGLLLAVSPVCAGLIAPASGTLSDRFGTRLISLTGLVLMASGCLLISTFDSQLSVLGYMRGYIPFGLGLGMFQSPNNSSIMGSVPRERLGIASGLLALSRTLGKTAGLPLMGALFASLTVTKAHLAPSVDVTTAPTEALVYGLQGAFRIAALIVLASVVVAAITWRIECRQHLTQTPSHPLIR